jgi:hypothetical protein
MARAKALLPGVVSLGRREQTRALGSDTKLLTDSLCCLPYPHSSWVTDSLTLLSTGLFFSFQEMQHTSINK